MDKTLGELIQEALKDLGWTNAELSRRTSFSATHIGNIINDQSPGTKSGKHTRLPAETVDRIADELKRPRALFRLAAGLLPEEADEIVKQFLALTPERRRLALAIVKILRAESFDSLRNTPFPEQPPEEPEEYTATVGREPNHKKGERR